MFQCKDLYTLTSLQKMKLLAGKQGLHKGIRWVYKAESLTLSRWVHGGELLIISKLVTSEPDFDLEKILKEAVSLGMSGALLLSGPNYIEAIPERVLALCDQKDFPLFAIPWYVPLVDFFEEIGYAIANSRLRQNTSEDILFSIIFDNRIDNSGLLLSAQLSARENSRLNGQIEEFDYPLSGANRFFILHINLPTHGRTAAMDAATNSDIEEYLKQILSDAGIPLLTSTYAGHIIGLTPKEDMENLQPLFAKALDYAGLTYPDLSCNIGVGNPVADLENLKQSYEQAAECIAYSQKLQLKKQVVDYAQLGLYQLFSAMPKDGALASFVKTQIGPLLAYDKENNSALTETLYAYLQHNCNLQDTANALFAHRNTVKYRLMRIEEILHKKISSAEVRLNLHLALYAKEVVM